MKDTLLASAARSMIRTAPSARPAALRYAAALLAVALAAVARGAVTPAFGPTALPFMFFFPAVAVVAWYSGTGPALVSIALSALAARYFFTHPDAPPDLAPSPEVATITFILASGMIVLAIQQMHAARRRLAEEVMHRRSAQEDLTRARDLLATTLTSIGDAVIVTDAAGVVTFLNGEAQRLTGWTSDEAIGRPLPEVFHIISEETRQPVDNPVEKVLRLGIVVGLANHTLLIRRDGTETPIDDSAAPIREANGPPSGVVLVFRDITEQRRADVARAHLAAIVESSGDVIISKDLDGIIRSWNASAERLFGYRPEEIIGKPVTILIPPERSDEEPAILERLRNGLPAERLETVRVTKDGKRVPVLLTVSPVRDRHGRIVGASKILRDVSDLVEAREALIQERERLATTLASIGDGVIITDAAGRVVFLNPEAEKLTGWTRDEAAGHPLPEIFKIIDEVTREPIENPVDKVLRLGTIVGLANHTILVTRDGREIPIDDSAAAIRREGGPLLGVVLVFRNDTERRRAEQALRESQARFAGVIDSAMDAIITVDARQRIVLFNPAAQRMFGCSAEEALGTPLDRFIPAGLREAHRVHVDRFGKTGITNRRMGALGTLSALRANGEEFPIEASISHTEVGGEKLFTVILRDLTDRQRIEQELTRHRENLEQMVAEKTEALRQSLEQLRRTERLASIGTLAAGVAHEINNPINSILLLAEYSLMDPDAEDRQEVLEKIRDEAQRAGRIVRSVLKFARDEKSHKEPADLNEVIAHSVELAGSYIQSAGLRLQLDLASALPPVRINRTEIEQVIINLIKSAAEATNNPVKVVIRTAREDGAVLLMVSDDGPGIPEEIQTQIFDPFFSTKRAIGGTGLGLSLCHSIITDHQGVLSVESRLARGTTFTIRLPTHDGAS